ncbi:hypothetical protein CMI42_02490 [Candidatus Pacearchaeota archaeon]|nr:hypothetical protein [Candidatus Pacearchaeota archaeon]|tara:strand:- start:1887 stop:3236 length:1350 start_codon:yes stop_codon:yes gene_type:complete
MKEENSIIVRELNKKFIRSVKNRDSFLSNMLNLFSDKKSRNEFDVLRDISFKVKKGENLGIIGRNGSGKSTLLRMINKIYGYDSGEIWTKGKVVYLTGFNHGLKKKLSMRDNIYLIGMLWGLDKIEINKRFDEIVEFSGLSDYLDSKVYQFSSGMINRLCFSITLHCVAHKNPDIMLIDEAINSGVDLEFKDKALKKIEELVRGGASVILVSHNLNLIKKYCDRVLLISGGKIINDGEPNDVIEGYIRKNTFHDVYQEKHWGKGDELFYSGTGSDFENCLPFRDYINKLIVEKDIRSIVDLGCGDFRMGNLLNLDGVNYVGVDIVDSLIEHNKSLYSRKNINFVTKDIVSEELPLGDLCIIRFVLQHLSNEDVLRIISKLKKYGYVIIVDGVNLERYKNDVNVDIESGFGLRDNGLHLNLAPFNLNVVKEGEYLSSDKKDLLRIFRVFL